MSSADDRGPTGPQGEAGTTGPQGETGVTGRQGEAGNIGPSGETGGQGEQGQTGEAGTAGLRGARGAAGPALTRRQRIAGAALVLFVFVVLSVRQEIQQRSIGRNQQDLRHNLYTQCLALNVGATRQNGLIDSAIAAERRRPQPDLQRIKDLTGFKVPRLGCGTPQ